MPMNARRSARFFAPTGADMPVCRSCWRAAAILRRGEIFVEHRRTDGPIAHQRRTCKAVRPGSEVDRDVFLAYVAPRPAVRLVDVNGSKTVA